VNKNNRNKTEHRRAPVYIPFKTFLTAVETFEQGIPPTLDRSVWPSFSGGTQSQTLGAFKFLGLINETGEVKGPLERLVDAKGDERKGVLREIIENQYAGAIQLAEQNASFQQLQEYFRAYGVQAGTLERVVRFFLDVCEYAGVKCSPLWSKAKKTLRRVSKKDETPSKVKPIKGKPAKSEGETKFQVRTIQLQSGGTLSLSLSVDLMVLSREDREWLFTLIDQLNAYGQAKDKE
jgi:hypothetical protein